MRIRTQKKVLIINLILILSIFIISLNQVFANEQEYANTKFIERSGETRFNNIPLDNHKFKKSILAAGPIAPTNTSFESAEIIQATNIKRGNANGFLGYYYKFVPQVTGIYNITNYAAITTESVYVNFSVTLFDSNEHEIASNIESTMILDEASGRLNEIIKYKNKISYAFIAGETYFIVINDISVSYKFDLNFEQSIEINKNELVLAIWNANKIHNEAVEGNQGGQYKIGAKAILKTAITAAQQVVDNINSTQTDINAAIVSLNTSINNFEKMKNSGIYEFEYDSVSYRLLYILKDGKRIIEFIYDENGNLKQKKKIIN